MKVLVVAYKYPPVLSPRAFRWGEIAEWLVKQGDRVFVVCSHVYGEPQADVRNGVGLSRIGKGTGTNSAWPQDVVQSPEVGSKAKGPLGRAIRAAFRWPDYARDFFAPALLAAAKVTEDAKPDVLVTVSHPFTPHLVGLELKKRFGVRWLADMGDPFALAGAPSLNNEYLFARRNRAYERAVLAHADVATVTNEETKLAMVRQYGRVAERVVVVPPLAPKIPAATGSSPQTAGAGPILMVAGRFYRKLRNPRPMLEVFRRLRQIPGMENAALHVYGSTRDCADLFNSPSLSEGVLLHGIVPREVVLAAYGQADGVINIGNATGLQLPSKVVELASTGKPIINFSASIEDSSYRFLANYPRCLQVLTDRSFDPQQGARLIAKLLASRTNEPDMSWLDSFLAPFQIEAVGGAYRKLLACES